MAGADCVRKRRLIGFGSSKGSGLQRKHPSYQFKVSQWYLKWNSVSPLRQNWCILTPCVMLVNSKYDGHGPFALILAKLMTTTTMVILECSCTWINPASGHSWTCWPPSLTSHTYSSPVLKGCKQNWEWPVNKAVYNLLSIFTIHHYYYNHAFYSLILNINNMVLKWFVNGLFNTRLSESMYATRLSLAVEVWCSYLHNQILIFSNEDQAYFFWIPPHHDNLPLEVLLVLWDALRRSFWCTL